MTYTIHAGSNLDVLPTLPDNSVDSIVTDPPYELGFMGKKWDNSGIAYSVELWTECLRVLKPGGHLLAFSGSRTYHRMVVAIEDAGFDIRDMISWISNKTFPKSLDVSKAIDKAAGVKPEVIGKRSDSNRGGGIKAFDDDAYEWKKEFDITAPSTPEAQKWQGWGTGLKPTVEPIVMARKPLIGTVAANVLEHGTGALNIDGSRIGTDAKAVQGRWPANVILDEYSAGELDDQSGVSKSGMRPPTGNAILDTGAGWNQNSMTDKTTRGFQDTGGASRFFYVAKASKRDRNEGLEGSNLHPTVKPTTLMRYLVKLVTPPNGTVLDPFTGSGSTGKAAILEGFDFIGIELTEEYLPIIEARLAHAEKLSNEDKGLF
tara:strand:- start:984 stop:2105 length:1122 start_codon:yes stop_codon:yes gene_type:complete